VKPVVVFPDAVLVVIEYLRSVMPKGTLVCSRVPCPVPAEFVRVQRLGGMRRSLVTDRPRVDVECWSETEAGAEALVATVRAYVLSMAGTRGDTTVYDVAEVSGPQWLPEDPTDPTGGVADTSAKPKYAFAVEFSTRGREMS